MKKRRFIFSIFLITWLLICGVAVAYMITRIESQNRMFVPAKVSCTVNETTDSPITKKTSITVKNTGNIESYIRVRLVSYWVQKIGNKTEIIAKESKVPYFKVGNDWIEGPEDTYYYANPVEAGEFTSDLLASELPLEEENADGTVCRQVVEVFAEAIQSNPESSVTTSWNVILNGKNISLTP